MLALRTTALTQADRKSLQRVRYRPKRLKTDTESNIFYRIGFIEHLPVYSGDFCDDQRNY